MRHLSAKAKGSSTWDRTRQSTGFGRFERVWNVLARLTGAIARAMFVVLLICTPSLLLPGISQDTSQIVVLVALFGGLIILFEYGSTYPCLIEFRFASPFNRMRFLSLFGTVFLLSIVFKGQTDPTTLTRFVHAVGHLVGHVIDFSYSPVRLMLLLLPDQTNTEHLNVMRAAAGLSYLVSLLTLAIFLIVLRVIGWPNKTQTFNFWTNLPTFDPTSGGDVVVRLNRDARVNIILGFVLPFMSPVVAGSASGLFHASMVESPQTLIWMISLWSFLPASLFMRGIAMNRIADMIDEKRMRGSRAVAAGLLPA